ncbi:UDP-N-acetyl-D-mannosamine dehydrogenase, partial [Erwinia amylovora]|nr:UDP-N-acetyl-D-mannosamine dehydrogenase [Erwinia amylovora]
IDINAHALATINRGEVHFTDPERDRVVKKAVECAFLLSATRTQPADAFLIAVPTPFTGNHQPDMTYVQAAAESVALVLKKGDLVILESTSPVGSTEQRAQWMAAARPDL